MTYTLTFYYLQDCRFCVKAKKKWNRVKHNMSDDIHMEEKKLERGQFPKYIKTVPKYKISNGKRSTLFGDSSWNAEDITLFAENFMTKEKYQENNKSCEIM